MSTAFDRAFRDLVLDPLIADPATMRTMKAHPSDFDEAILDEMEHGQRRCDTTTEALWYCYSYMYCHFDAYATVIERNAGLFDRIVLGASRPVQMADFGCGPLTSGLALAEYCLAAKRVPISLRYAGVDSMAPMLAKAAEFAGRKELFRQDSRPVFRQSISVLASELATTGACAPITLVLNFSYFLGQEDVSCETVHEIACLVRQSLGRSDVEAVYLVYLNVEPEELNKKYMALRLELDLPAKLPPSEQYAYRVLRRFSRFERLNGTLRQEVVRLKPA